jgi:hypothetical protein
MIKIKKAIGALYSWPRSAPTAVSSATCHRPATTPVPQDQEPQKVRVQPTHDSTTQNDQALPATTGTRDCREFGMTKIVAIYVLTEDDLAICDLGERRKWRAYCR